MVVWPKAILRLDADEALAKVWPDGKHVVQAIEESLVGIGDASYIARRLRWPLPRGPHNDIGELCVVDRLMPTGIGVKARTFNALGDKILDVAVHGGPATH